MTLEVEARLSQSDTGRQAAAQEAAGYCGSMAGESNLDPFLTLVDAARATERMELGTAVAIAFARSPMTMAYTAHQLQSMTEGRFVLGLGSQVRAHVLRRFSMGWDAPVARMGEFLTALRTIWSSWREGTELHYVGQFYEHTLMPPSFVPEPHPYPDPPLILAAVGPEMTRLACTHADGLFIHPFTGADYLRAVSRPRIDLALADRTLAHTSFRISANVLVATGKNGEQLRESVSELRAQIAFYGSTPAYRGILEHLGFGHLADRLHELSRSADSARWHEMSRHVPDELVHRIGIVAEPDGLADEIVDRYDGLVDRVSLSVRGPSDPDLMAAVAQQIANR